MSSPSFVARALTSGIRTARATWMPPPGCGSRTSGTVAPRSPTRRRHRCGAWPRTHTFGDLTNDPTAALTDRVAALAPMADAKVFLTSGGSDSDRHRHQDGASLLDAHRPTGAHGADPPREGLPRDAHRGHVARRIPANADGYGPLLHEVVEVPWDDADASPATIDQLGEGRVAGVLLRAGDRRGRRVPAPAGYLEPARASAASPACCSSRTRSSRGSAGAGRGSRAARSGSSPTWSPARRASPAATCRSAR